MNNNLDKINSESIDNSWINNEIELGITQEYNKDNRDKLWDSNVGKKEFKEDTFGNRQTYQDQITGKTLHKGQKSAQRKYHMKNNDGENISTKWAEHSSETDHINSIKSVHEKNKGNKFLSDKDLKEIVNSKENYRVTSKRFNTEKGEKSDWSIVLKKDKNLTLKGRAIIAKQKLKADIVVNGKIITKTSKNIAHEFTYGAKSALDSSVIPLISIGVGNMCKVATGEKTLDEAVKDEAKAAAEIMIVGGTDKIISRLLSKNCLLSSNNIGKITSVVMVVKDAAIKYANGETTEKEFLEEIESNGVALVTSIVIGEGVKEIFTVFGATVGNTALPIIGGASGAIVGRIVGEVLSTIITTATCSIILPIINANREIYSFKKSEARIKQIEKEAILEINKQREYFKTVIEKSFKQWDDNIYNSFNQIIMCSCEESFELQGITGGIDNILKMFGKEVAFKNLSEYEEQLNSTLKLKI